jgi:preprotein translocase subunit Sec61beta
MAQDNRIHMPAGFGGLVRFDEEFKSKIMLKPVHIIGFVILIILFRIVLDIIH